MKCETCLIECDRKYCSTDCYHKSRVVQCSQEWIDLYSSGLTLEELSAKVGKSVAQISVLLRRGGAKMRHEPSKKQKMATSVNRRRYFENPENRRKVSREIKKYHQNDTVKTAYRLRFLEQIASGNIKISCVSKLENDVAGELKKCGLSFIQQAVLRLDNTHVYRVDLFLDNGCIVEVNGTYWHCDPRSYPNGPVNDIQKRCVERQQKKAEQMKLAGIIVCEIWEADFRSNKCFAISKLVEQITNAARNPNALNAAQDALQRAGKKQ